MGSLGVITNVSSVAGLDFAGIGVLQCTQQQSE